MPRRQLSFLNILTMATILASVIVILTEFGSMMSAQGQVNASSLTPEQKDAICNPNNPASKLNPVNTTESRICGIPVTVKPHPSNTTAATTETGTEIPSVVPTPP
jgi:cell division protein FtsN